jgi:septum formation protein
MSTPDAPLILASASPRRRELLHNAGLRFRVIPSQTAEEVRPGEAPRDYVRRTARDKARAVARGEPTAWILAADTIVEIDGQILGKPRDEADGRRMLGLLSGRQHRVMTAFVVLGAGHRVERLVTSTVRFKTLSEAQIGDYLASGEPADKAGAYAIQGRGRALVADMQGSYTNVVGLPMDEVLVCLQTLGIHTLPVDPVGKAS